MLEKNTFTTTISGTTVTASFTNLAEQASASVLMSADDTTVLVTVAFSEYEAKQNYFPLSVEYEERFYSVGAILGSRFMRREGRPSQEAVLNARIIDRTIRPLFPKELHNEIQVIATVLSFGKYNADTLAILGASLALGTSHIPWNGPVSAVRFTKTDENWNAFAPFEEEKASTDQILMCGKEDCITMIEMEGGEVAESTILEVGKKAMSVIADLQKFQNEVIAAIGKKKMSLTPHALSPDIQTLFDTEIRPTLATTLFSSNGRTTDLEHTWKKLLEAQEGCSSTDIRIAEEYFHSVVDDIIHAEAVENGRRVDGRGVDEIRPLYAQAGGISSRLHGSGIFYRGGTHVFSALTLGAPSDTLTLNTVENPDFEQRFMLHYNFPPYSTGETGRVGSPKRREIGHGALAEKALRPVLPKEDTFPYAVRLVSECFASNGSTSMGSVCAGTLALMDGGVPIIAPVAGIAIGLMQHNDTHVVLTDIQGPEDHHGDMDFKVAGTKNGITAIQMDVKIAGITSEIFAAVLEKGKIARLAILDTITEAINEPRESLSQYAPHIATLSIDPDSIGAVIGTGGKVIKGIRSDTGVDSIDIEDDGVVTISGDQEAVAKAMGIIQNLTRSFEVGDTVDGKIKTITDFGVFVELSPNKDGMVHISEFSPKHVVSIEDIAAVGDVVPVVIKEVRGDGRIALSVKDRDPTFFDALLENAPKNKNPRSQTVPKRRGPPRNNRR